jgi:hypothetical protein
MMSTSQDECTFVLHVDDNAVPTVIVIADKLDEQILNLGRTTELQTHNVGLNCDGEQMSFNEHREAGPIK